MRPIKVVPGLGLFFSTLRPDAFQATNEPLHRGTFCLHLTSIFGGQTALLASGRQAFGCTLPARLRETLPAQTRDNIRRELNENIHGK